MWQGQQRSSSLQDEEQQLYEYCRGGKAAAAKYIKGPGGSGRDIIYGYGLVDAASAVASEPEETVITLTRSHKLFFEDIQSISLSDALYSITIRNKDLKAVWILVFEKGHYREDLSSAIISAVTGKSRKRQPFP